LKKFFNFFEKIKNDGQIIAEKFSNHLTVVQFSMMIISNYSIFNFHFGDDLSASAMQINSSSAPNSYKNTRFFRANDNTRFSEFHSNSFWPCGGGDLISRNMINFPLFIFIFVHLYAFQRT